MAATGSLEHERGHRDHRDAEQRLEHSQNDAEDRPRDREGQHKGERREGKRRKPARDQIAGHVVVHLRIARRRQ